MAKYTTILFFAVLSALAGCQENRTGPKIQTSVQIVFGHSHTMTVRYQDVNNGRETYVLEENAGHHHEIRITPENRSLLLLRMPITVDSTEAAGHSHAVSLAVADD